MGKNRMGDVEFLDYVTMQSQDDRPLFSDGDIVRFKEMYDGSGLIVAYAEATPQPVLGYKFMRYQKIKDVLAHIWKGRLKALEEPKDKATAA